MLNKKKNDPKARLAALEAEAAGSVDVIDKIVSDLHVAASRASIVAADVEGEIDLLLERLDELEELRGRALEAQVNTNERAARIAAVFA